MTGKNDRVVVLGGGFLGVNAALDLARNDLEVVLIDQSTVHEYIPGSIDLIRNRFDFEQLSIDLNSFLPEKVDLKQTQVKEIKPDQETVVTSEGEIDYDKLVVGLGGEPANFGMDISDAYHVWGLSPAQKLTKKAEESDSAIIVGGGYVGMEVAGELSDKGLDTTIIDGSTRPLSYLTLESSEKILDVLNSKGISFRGDVRAESVSEDCVKVEGSDEVLEADFIVWAGGVQANPIVQKSFDVDGKGVEVNEKLNVEEYSDVWAGGDCADLEGQKTAHKAMHQGEIIAKNMLGKKNQGIEAEQKILVASIGNTAALIYKNKVLGISKIFRKLKDLIKTYYFIKLKVKKRFNVSFLP